MNQELQDAEFVQLDARNRGSPWEAVLARFGGRYGVLAVFALAHAAMLLCGYAFKESPGAPALMWPAAGTLFAALWLSQRSYWPALIGIQIALEVVMVAWMQPPFVPRVALLFALSNTIDGVVGASIAGWLIADRSQVRTAQTLQFIFACFVGSAVAATLGAWINATDVYGPMSYLQQFQNWGFSGWLGSLTVVPVVFCWVVPVRRSFRELELPSRIEVGVLAVLLAASTVYIFEAGAGGAVSVLQLPIVTVALLGYAACRLPPRWAATLAMGTGFICAGMASRRLGPFVAVDPFMRAAQLQTFLAVLIAMTYVLSTSMTEMRIGLGRLKASESRYRNFVDLSTEAVWRVELLQPMPVVLPLAEQIAWLREKGRIAEYNLSYRQLDAATPEHDLAFWRTEVPWSGIYEKHLELAAKQHYSLDGLRFTVNLEGRVRTFLTSFSGVVDRGQLLRIWGVARDITELVELNARLLREQDRLKTYARQIVNAEEKARRATAVDLHDGIGQSLVGMSMTLEVAREQAAGDVRLLIDEVRVRLREVQERTRHVISDLSPPGLYDLGLAPALQWLAVYVRSHDRLHVELDARVREESIRIETRVLVFKLVRELLRNVVKHAGVSAARVLVQGDSEQLQVEVSDAGKGFEWQMDMFGGRSGGFGLWSIADRVHEAGGQFTVDTAPGRGSRFNMSFPLRAAGQSGEKQGFVTTGTRA